MVSERWIVKSSGKRFNAHLSACGFTPSRGKSSRAALLVFVARLQRLTQTNARKLACSTGWRSTLKER